MKLTAKQWIKVIFKSKTMVFGILLTFFGLIADQISVLQPFMTPEYFSKFTSFIAAIVMVLRLITNDSLASKIKDAEQQIEDAVEKGAAEVQAEDNPVKDSEIVEEGAVQPSDQKA